MVIGIWNKDAEWSGGRDFSNFGSLKSTEMFRVVHVLVQMFDFSNFGSLKSTEIYHHLIARGSQVKFQQFRLVEEH